MKQLVPLCAAVMVIMTIATCSKNREFRSECPEKYEVRQPKIGSNIPDIEMDAFYKGKITKIKLSEYRGKWLILFFYPADFTFICPTELKELADYYKEFTQLGAEIVSVSTDSVFVHAAWHKQNKLVGAVQYPMLSDHNGKLCKAMGTLNEGNWTAYRATYLIDPDNNIIAYEYHHDSIGRSVDELFRKLNAAIAVREGHGGLCPAGWEPGSEMIRPE